MPPVRLSRFRQGEAHSFRASIRVLFIFFEAATSFPGRRVSIRGKRPAALMHPFAPRFFRTEKTRTNDLCRQRLQLNYTFGYFWKANHSCEQRALGARFNGVYADNNLCVFNWLKIISDSTFASAIYTRDMLAFAQPGAVVRPDDEANLLNLLNKTNHFKR